MRIGEQRFTFDPGEPGGAPNGMYDSFAARVQILTTRRSWAARAFEQRAATSR